MKKLFLVCIKIEKKEGLGNTWKDVRKKAQGMDGKEEGKPEKTWGGSKSQGNVEGPLLKQSMKLVLAL